MIDKLLTRLNALVKWNRQIFPYVYSNHRNGGWFFCRIELAIEGRGMKKKRKGGKQGGEVTGNLWPCQRMMDLPRNDTRILSHARKPSVNSSHMVAFFASIQLHVFFSLFSFFSPAIGPCIFTSGWNSSTRKITCPFFFPHARTSRAWSGICHSTSNIIQSNSFVQRHFYAYEILASASDESYTIMSTEISRLHTLANEAGEIWIVLNQVKNRGKRKCNKRGEP